MRPKCSLLGTDKLSRAGGMDITITTRSREIIRGAGVRKSPGSAAPRRSAEDDLQAREIFYSLRLEAVFIANIRTYEAFHPEENATLHVSASCQMGALPS